MEDGSLGSLIYLTNGDPHFEKERVEVFGQGRAALTDNWRLARLSGQERKRKVRPVGTGKGHGLEIDTFVRAVTTSDEAPLPLADATHTTLCTFAIARAIATGEQQHVET